MRLRLRTRVAAVVAVGALVPVSFAEVLYSVTEIECPAGSANFAFGLNDRGQVVGTMGVAGGSCAFLRNPDGVVRALPNWGGNLNAAYAINESGEIVGWANTGTDSERAVTYGQGNVITLLAGAGNFSHAWGLNDSGTVVGGVDWTSVLWEQSGSSRAIESEGSEAWAINNSGEIAGWSYFGGGYRRAALWSQNGTVQNLGTLKDADAVSIAFDINESGQVVGTSGSAGFVYDTTNGMRDLGTLAGEDTQAMAINDVGQVVGESTVGGESHAFLYQSGRIVDLNELIDPSLGWTVSMGFDINNAGQIVGYGRHDGLDRAFLLTPVPDPGMLLLLVSGILWSFKRGRGWFSGSR